MTKVLIVDDSAIMRKIIQRNIKETGLMVDEYIEAGDGNQAIDKVNSNQDLDLVLLDWNMPNTDGTTFINTLRSLDLSKKIPVVAITTEGTDDKVEQIKNSDADGLITKPFTYDQLRDTLGDHLLTQ